MKNYIDLDKQYLWHPYTQAQNASDPICITRAEGSKLFDQDGREYLDMISSWWVNVHGHAHPKIAAAIAAQARDLEQVIFADFTHPPAAEFAASLVKTLKRDKTTELSRVFFSDSGSAAVEVAVKQALHYWRNLDKPQRRRFIAFDGGYHGDTVGAMSLGKQSGFFTAYSDLLFDVIGVPFAATWLNDAAVEEKEQAALAALEAVLNEQGHNCAAIIMEPLVQGAAGMRVCRPHFIKACADLARQHGVLVIFDEVMTGFGRTGTFCAYEHCGVVPDILCLAKGLSGGFLPLSATISAEKIYQAFMGTDFSRALAHGHSYGANPIACAAGIASISLFKSENSIERIKAIESVHHNAFEKLSKHPSVLRPRYIGSIAAFDLDVDSNYGSKISQDIKMFFLNRGVLIRPIGNSIYLMPPYCVTAAELKQAYEAISESLSVFGRSAMPLVA